MTDEHNEYYMLNPDLSFSDEQKRRLKPKIKQPIRTLSQPVPGSDEDDIKRDLEYAQRLRVFYDELFPDDEERLEHGETKGRHDACPRHPRLRFRRLRADEARARRGGLPADAVLIHGGATGADTLADRWAVVNFVKVEVFEADWVKWRDRCAISG
jgi:YspA, cpYpsA-related SLOG family